MLLDRPEDRRRTGRRRSISWVLVAVAVLLGLVGCGSSGEGSASSTTVGSGSTPNADDFDRLSLFLLRDRQAGGADLVVRFESSGEKVVLRGVVDWVDHSGSIEVSSTASDGTNTQPYEVRFSEDRVYEPVAEETQTSLAAGGRAGIEWSSRAPDVEGDPLDRILALLVSFSAEQPDNPALLDQRGVTVERHEAVGGDDATVYRTKAEALYWVLDDSGVLARFQGTVIGLDGPVTIDLTDHGPRRVEVPDAAAVIDRSDLAGS